MEPSLWKQKHKSSIREKTQMDITRNRLLILLILLSGLLPSLGLGYSGGSGTLQDPYQIATTADLIALGNEPNDYGKCFILTANIDLDSNLAGGKVFDRAVIAPDTGTPFSGVFEGNGHVIRNLRIVSNSDYIGLFGQVDAKAEIRDLGLENVVISGAGNVIGALAGMNLGTVSCCYSAGNVLGTNIIGGLVGQNGELVGDVVDPCIMDSYSLCAVGGKESIGGLVGYNVADLSNCYSTGRVTGDGILGGLAIGIGVVAHCFWDTQTSGQATSDGGMGLTTAQMQDINTYRNAGWKIYADGKALPQDARWTIKAGHYPRLSWQPAIVFVDIPAGTFQMGDHDGSGYSDERPVHTVTLNGFQMSQYETTNAQYATYLNAAMAGGLIQVVNGVVYASSDSSRSQSYCDTHSSSSYSQIEYSQGQFTVLSRDNKVMADHPVVRVSWYGAKAFCDHYGYRLPTEAEWEYAARGGYHDPYYRYPWGSNTIDCSKANYYNGSSYCNPLGLTSYPYTSPVGYYGPQGAYGLCDMSGNVWEWCQDWYDSAYYGESPGSNPTGPASGSFRVFRGGSWYGNDHICRVATRGRLYPVLRRGDYGFRVCR